MLRCRSELCCHFSVALIAVSNLTSGQPLELSKSSCASEIKCISASVHRAWLTSGMLVAYGKLHIYLSILTFITQFESWICKINCVHIFRKWNYNISKISCKYFNPLILLWKGITDQSSSGNPIHWPLICVYIRVSLSAFNSFNINLSTCWLYTVIDKPLKL